MVSEIIFRCMFQCVVEKEKYTLCIEYIYSTEVKFLISVSELYLLDSYLKLKFNQFNALFITYSDSSKVCKRDKCYTGDKIY